MDARFKLVLNKHLIKLIGIEVDIALCLQPGLKGFFGKAEEETADSHANYLPRICKARFII